MKLPELRSTDLHRQLLALLDAVRHRSVRLLKEGQLGRRTRGRLLDELGLRVSPAPDEALNLLLELAQGLNLIRLRGARLRVEPEASGDFFRSSRSERVRRLSRSWLHAHEPGPPGDGDEASERPRAPRRRGLLQVLRDELSSDEERPAERVFERLSRTASDSEPQLASQLRELAELGLLCPEAWRSGALRLTEPGAFALGLAHRPPERRPSEGRVLVQPNFQVVVLAQEAELSLLYEVGRFAEPSGAPPVFSYTMTARSVLRAGLEGLSLEQVEGFLTQRAGALPQNVAQTFASWRQAQASLRIARGVSLVEFEDSAEAEEMAGLLHDLPGVELVGSRLLMLPSSDRDRIARLLGTNHFADLDYREDVLPPWLTLGAGLSLEVDEASTNLRSNALLERIGLQDEGGWRLDGEALRAQLSSEQASLELREELSSAFSGGLPASVQLILDEVGEDVPALHLVQAPLLFVESEEALDHVLQLDSLRHGVLRRLGPHATLLTPEGAEKLREELRSLGLASVDTLPPREDGAVEEQAETPEDVRRVLRSAVRQSRDVLVRYDPGARRPIELIRFRPERVESRRGRHYAHGYQPGAGERVLSLSYIRSVSWFGD